MDARYPAQYKTMRVVLVTKDKALAEAAREGCAPYDVEAFEAWPEALEACEGADLLFVDQIATLQREHEIEGYVAFAKAKMAHPKAAKVPLVLISPPNHYDLDYQVGWDKFLIANVRRPVEAKLFRRATTWV